MKVPRQLIQSTSSLDGTSINSSNCASFSLELAKCRCESLWTNELHGLTQFATVDRLQFPSLVICPKNADAIHIEGVLDDLARHVHGLDRIVALDVLRFAIAGFGFANFEEDIQKWNDETVDNLGNYYYMWRDNRTEEEMFHLIFEHYGYTCEEVFYQCYQSGVVLNCCDFFYFTYVMLRARCLRLGTVFQNDNEEVAKLSISFRNIPSPLCSKTFHQPQLSIYINDHHEDVWLNPRYYINAYDWNRMRFRIRRKQLLESNVNCRVPEAREGTGTCAIERWLDETVVKSLNCTFCYLQEHHPNVTLCDPRTVIYNYDKVILTPSSEFRCLPACYRNEVTIQLYSSLSMFSSDDPRVFMLESSFGELQFEEYKEVVRTTLPGFVSQIGGQGGLFLGASVVTFVQLFISFANYFYERTRRFLLKLKQQ
ncbi:unnamed protein product [Enterobius vermicularis]|uniref:Amiloride-sensitive sodium channel n=1 Tax=Enterobius vermicularis TaxID=51028 RepID=A0A0N4VAP5_ENTVE|nr:unnamed protein product [Enterobius vermicularis]